MTSEYRKVSVKLPKNKRFRSVDHTAKLVYYYAISNPLSNSAGCYEINPAEIGFDLVLDDRAIHRAIEALSEAGLISWDSDNEVLLIERALKHWPITNSKHAAGAISRLLELPDCILRSRRISEFLDQDKLDDEQKKHLQSILEKSVPPDRAMIGLSPSRTRTRTKSKSKPRPDISPPSPPKGGVDSSNPDNPENPVLEGEVLNARQEEQAEASLPHPVKPQVFPEAVNLWNEFAKASGLSVVQNFNNQRQGKLTKHLKEFEGLEGWRTMLEVIGRSPHLLGVNDRGWRATFDWVLNETNYTKIMEKNYERTGESKSGTQTASDKLREGIANAVMDRALAS